VGLLAVYLGVPPDADERLGDLDPDGVVDFVEGLLEGGAPSVDVDKAWDGLHFLLTGTSASTPIEDDALSEAVVGVYEFESDDFLGLTPTADLPRVIAALEAVDIDARLSSADFSAFHAAELYPNIWTDDRAALESMLRAAFGDLLAVHRLCLADGLDLLVSIY